MKNNITFISSSRDTKEYFNALSKQANKYSEKRSDLTLYEYGFTSYEIRTKDKCYSIPISFEDRGLYNETYYKNIENCFNYLKLFCDKFNLSFKGFRTMRKNRENTCYRMAFAWCAKRAGFNKFVIAEVMSKNKKSIDYYINKMNYFRYEDIVLNKTCDEFKIVIAYEKV